MSAHKLTSAGRAAALSGAIAMAAAMGFGRFSFTPILPGMITGLSLSPGDAGLIAAGNFAGYLFGAILAAFSWAAGRERLLGLAALAANAALLIAMGLGDSVPVFVLIRFLAGLSSAFAMIFISSIVLGHANAPGGEKIQSAHFGGVGAGIALSSLAVYLIGLSGAGTWRIDWLAGGAITLIAFVLVWFMLPATAFAAHAAPKEPPIVWTRPVVRLILSYGLFGFGYVVTATFIVAMARMAHMGAVVEFLSWFVAGCTAAVSLLVWRPAMQRIGLGGAYVVAMIIEALGVLASVSLQGLGAPLIGGALLGATFMVITAYGLRLARELSPASPRRALALMTAAFGLGQIAGPLVAGAVAQASGSFTLPSLLAAGALAISTLLAWPLRRCGRP